MPKTLLLWRDSMTPPSPVQSPPPPPPDCTFQAENRDMSAVYRLAGVSRKSVQPHAVIEHLGCRRFPGSNPSIPSYSILVKSTVKDGAAACRDPEERWLVGSDAIDPDKATFNVPMAPAHHNPPSTAAFCTEIQLWHLINKEQSCLHTDGQDFVVEKPQLTPHREGTPMCLTPNLPHWSSLLCSG